MYRVALTRLVTSSLRLGIETGRWQRPILPGDNRICGICGKLDDEYHFLLKCFALKDIRQKHIIAFDWKRSSMFKCVQLVRSPGRTRNNHTKFVYVGFSLKWLLLCWSYIVAVFNQVSLINVNYIHVKYRL